MSSQEYVTGGAGSTTSAMDVLLVEDSAVDARVIQNLLGEAGAKGFSCAMATSMAEALDHLRSHTPGVILLDLHLPDSDGLTTAIRILEEAEHIPVVVFTGLDNEAMGVAAVQEGAQDYLVKGHVTAALLRRSIHYAVQRHDMLTHLTRALEQARAGEANLRNVLSHSRDGVVVVDADGRIVFVNASAEQLYGKTSQDLLGHNFSQPLSVGSVRQILLARDGFSVPVEMRTLALEWSGDPAWLVWLRELPQGE